MTETAQDLAVPGGSTGRSTDRSTETAGTAATADTPGSAARGGFTVHLTNFEGPFDLLLGLISKHKLDVTEVALSQVTDEFIAHIKTMGAGYDLGVTTEFLVVAATLLDLKAARLLPAGDVEDEEDLALLEARDLLFARLLQYRAYKEVAQLFGDRMSAESRVRPRAVGLDPALAGLLPEVLLGLGPAELAGLAARALAPRPVPSVSVAHLHAPAVSVREQAAVLVGRLRAARTATFRALVADAPDRLTVVARFLALLELFREGAVTFEQVDPLGELHVRWTGTDAGEVGVADEFDVPPDPDDADAHAHLDPDADPDRVDGAAPEVIVAAATGPASDDPHWVPATTRDPSSEEGR